MTAMDITQRIACKAVIVNDDKILVMREATTYDEGTNTGRYHFPGGRINPGEPFLDGLHREIKEETGLEVEVGDPLFVGEWFPVIKEVKNQIVAVFFVCKFQGGGVVLSEEHDDYKWVNREEATQIDMMVPDDEVAEKYFASVA
jgi:8-oxo-dGTP diphosphatase